MHDLFKNNNKIDLTEQFLRNARISLPVLFMESPLYFCVLLNPYRRSPKERNITYYYFYKWTFTSTKVKIPLIEVKLCLWQSIHIRTVRIWLWLKEFLTKIRYTKTKRGRKCYGKDNMPHWARQREKPSSTRQIVRGFDGRDKTCPGHPEGPHH